MGEFGLRTVFNLGALPQTNVPPVEGAQLGIGPIEAPGPRGTTLTLGDLEIVYDMDPYDNQPWDLQGFQNRAVDYLRTIHRSQPPNPEAPETEGGPG